MVRFILPYLEGAEQNSLQALNLKHKKIYQQLKQMKKKEINICVTFEDL